ADAGHRLDLVASGRRRTRHEQVVGGGDASGAELAAHLVADSLDVFDLHGDRLLSHPVAAATPSRTRATTPMVGRTRGGPTPPSGPAGSARPGVGSSGSAHRGSRPRSGPRRDSGTSSCSPG